MLLHAAIRTSTRCRRTYAADHGLKDGLYSADTDCKDGLKCGQRHNDENVTGCLPGGTRGRDYCYIPPIPFYVDTIGGHKDHALISNPDQNPVTYTMW
jgi:hypothetical protein